MRLKDGYSEVLTGFVNEQDSALGHVDGGHLAGPPPVVIRPEDLQPLAGQRRTALAESPSVQGCGDEGRRWESEAPTHHQAIWVLMAIIWPSSSVIEQVLLCTQYGSITTQRCTTVRQSHAGIRHHLNQPSTVNRCEWWHNGLHQQCQAYP